MKPYFQNDRVTIYHGDCMELLPTIEPVEAIITDPPYEETNLEWDVWPDGWPAACAPLSRSLWCFGSLRMFLDRRDEFSGWTLAQEIVWEKHNGSGAASDRFRRVHELAVQFYQGPWAEVFKSPVMTLDASARTVRRTKKPAQWGGIGPASYVSEDGGPRLMRSVIPVRSCHGHAIHPTQKPEGIISPLIEYSVPDQGTVLDPFMGSGSVLATADRMGRKAIGIEANEEFCEAAAQRLSNREMALV